MTEVTKMNRTGFINQLAAVADITEEQAAQIDAIIEAHPIVGKDSKSVAVAEISETLGLGSEEAKKLSDTAYGLIKVNIKNKLLHPFGGND